MLNNITNYTNLINNKKVRTLLDATDLFTIGVRDANFYGNYQPALITATDLVSSVASLLPSTLPYWLEYNQSDLTIWNNGKGNISSNTSFGEYALAGNSGGYCTAIGERALAMGTGSFNTAIGGYAISNLISSDHNTAVGAFALAGNLTGSYNTAVGSTSLGSITSGARNTAIGYYTLGFNVSGDENTAVGHQALNRNTTGYNNVAIGESVSINNTTGYQNTSIGANALTGNTTGSGNVAIGSYSLYYNTTGVNNVAIGPDTDSGNFSGSVILGKLASATANNQFVVGSTSWNAGSVTSEVNASSNVWNVVINGVARKILLA